MTAGGGPGHADHGYAVAGPHVQALLHDAGRGNAGCRSFGLRGGGCRHG